MRTVNTELVAERREQILIAAARCFRERGFHGSSIKNICEAAGLSLGLLYHYFRNKEEIIAVIIERELDHVMVAFERLAGEDRRFDVLVNLNECTLRTLLVPSEYDLSLEVWAELERNPQFITLLENHYTALKIRVIKAILQAQEQGDIDPALDPEELAEVLGALFDGLMLRHHRENGKLPWVKLASLLRVLFTRFLRPAYQ